jgi:exosortase C (VPDSG-CTERM-specific)
MPNKPSRVLSRPIVTPGPGVSNECRSQWRSFILGLAVLIVCFGLPLCRLFLFVKGDELYSYIILMPFVSLYLIRFSQPAAIPDSDPWRGAGLSLICGGAAVMAAHLQLVRGGAYLAPVDNLSLTTLAFYLGLLGVACLFLGRETMRATAFAFGILIFIVPMPAIMRDAIVVFLQYGSTFVAEGLFRMAGTPVLRDDLLFSLPGTPALEVAPECSGIHSSWILLITSLLAGYMFLRSPWKRVFLAAAVVPLALLRNGFRVFTIGELCVHIGPQMIKSPVHKHGGPLFFVLSLIPFFILLAWLRRSERRKYFAPTKP